MESKLSPKESFNTLEEIDEEEKKLHAQLLEAIELMRAAESQCVIQKSKLYDLKQSKQRLERQIQTDEKSKRQAKSAATSHLDSLKSEMGIFNHVIEESEDICLRALQTLSSLRKRISVIESVVFPA